MQNDPLPPPAHSQFLASIEHDARLIAGAARKGIDAAVPTCPGWSVHDLVLHTGRIHRQKELVVRTGVTDRDFEWQEPGSDIADWFMEGARKMLKALRSKSPEMPAWTWFPEDQTVGFWNRRMAHETLIHRIDAELAHGTTSQIDPVIAADGVDEVLKVFIDRRPPWATVDMGERSVHLSCGGRDWWLRVASYSGQTRSGRVIRDVPALRLEESGNGPDCVISGSPTALNLWLWGRGTLGNLNVTGDHALADYVRQVAAKST